MTPEERAERLRQRLLFHEETREFIEAAAEEIREAIAEEREACAKFCQGFANRDAPAWYAGAYIREGRHLLK